MTRERWTAILRCASYVVVVAALLAGMARRAAAQDIVDDENFFANGDSEWGQYDGEVEGISEFLGASGVVDSYVETDVDYNLQWQGWAPYEEAYLWLDNGEQPIDEDYDYDINLQTTISMEDNLELGHTYTLDGSHFIYSTIACNPIEDWGDCSPIVIGWTEVQMNAGVPYIDSISPDSAPVGSSGTITLTGDYLVDPFTCDNTPSITGAGIGLSFSDGDCDYGDQASLDYQISTSASTGNQTLTVATRFGTSNGGTFDLYDPMPVINSVTSPWPTGQTTFVTVAGSGFGTSPSVSLSDSSMTISSLSVNSDGTQITFYVTVPGTDPNTSATVTVTSNGYTGNGFVYAPPPLAQSNQAQSTVSLSTTEHAQITNVTLSSPTLVNNEQQINVYVQIYHEPSGSLQNPTVQVNIGTMAGYPPGNAVTYTGDTSKTVDISGPQGVVTETFTVGWAPGSTIAGTGGTCPPSTYSSATQTGSACVQVGLSLTNPNPVGSGNTGVIISAPSPASNGYAILNTHQ